MTVVLGIDPGSRFTGYGIIQRDGLKNNYVDSGCIKTKVKDFPHRLKLIYTEVNKIINLFRPDCLAIEQVFMAKNANSALKLGQAKAAAMIAAINLNIPIFEYSAKQVKQTVVGFGSAEKSQVKSMVSIILTLPLYYNLQSDAADALAIAITHCHFQK